MQVFIGIVTAIIVIGYIVLSIYMIVKCETVGKSIGTSAGMLAGGCMVVPVAYGLATVICPIIVYGFLICLGLVILYGIFS